MSNHLYIVGIDGSEWSERAAAKAFELAKDTGAHIKLIYVMNYSVSSPMLMDGVVPPPVNYKEEEKGIHAQVITPLTEQYKDSGVAFESEIIWGEPVELLRDKIKSERAHMVFVGRRGRSRIADIIVGSIANKLAHCVGVPIVLVP